MTSENGNSLSKAGAYLLQVYYFNEQYVFGVSEAEVLRKRFEYCGVAWKDMAREFPGYTSKISELQEAFNFASEQHRVTNHNGELFRAMLFALGDEDTSMILTRVHCSRTRDTTNLFRHILEAAFMRREVGLPSWKFNLKSNNLPPSVVMESLLAGKMRALPRSFKQEVSI